MLLRHIFASRCSSWAEAEGRAPARAGAGTGSGGGRLMSDYVCITAIGICHARAKLLTRRGGGGGMLNN